MVREFYPIPVVSLRGLCDIEIHDDEISVSSKLKRPDALALDYTVFCKYRYEVYGVGDYLYDYYHNGMTLKQLYDNIVKSDETVI